MLIESMELTMSHVGLGNLNEYALMVLFGNAHSHQLVEGTGLHPDNIRDRKDHILYPAYFMTHLKIPYKHLLSSYCLWEKLQVGIDVKRFGETILDSSYILGREGEISSNSDEWDCDAFPSMEANNLFIIDVANSKSSVRQISAPKSECIANLEKMRKPPLAIKRCNEIREQGFLLQETFRTKEPIRYHVVSGRDAAPGHAMIFAKFCEVMDYAEYVFLSQHLKPGMPVDVLDSLSILEREIYYYANCFAGETLEIYIKGNIEDCPADVNTDGLECLPIGILNYQIEIYQEGKNILMAIAKVKKLISISMSLQNYSLDIKRLIRDFNLKG